MLEALADGRGALPSVDGAFPDQFMVEATAVQGDLGSSDFTARFPEEATTGDDKESGRSWSAKCLIRVCTELDGHHLRWSVVDTDTVPGEGSGYMTGWATFAGGIMLTSYRDMDFSMPPYLSFTADSSTGDAPQSWRGPTWRSPPAASLQKLCRAASLDASQAAWDRRWRPWSD